MKNKKPKSVNTKPVKWEATLVDVSDGSGDCYIELPDALLDQLNWKLGDVIDVGLDDKNKIIARKIR